ncbi:MAG: gliding motility-associated C-terminal domain-containing protein [Elusimicrobia bacterium]|nr:gliding motility-associated C-terminal domain-containing protein [Elusimicrobiota bacterium]
MIELNFLKNYKFKWLRLSLLLTCLLTCLSSVLRSIDLALPAGISDLIALGGDNEGEVRLIWTAPGDDELAGKITGYLIKYDEVPIRTDPWFLEEGHKEYIYNWEGVDIVGPGEKQTITLTALTSYVGKRLYFAVKGYDENSNFGVWNSTLDVAGINSNSSCYVRLIPPAPVGNLSATASYKKISLAWTAPGDDGNINDISGGIFEIRCSKTAPITTETDWDNVSAGYPYRIMIPTSTSPGVMQQYLITGLENDVSYYFAIKTRDENILGWSELDTTSPEPSGTPFNALPAAFNLISPADKAFVPNTKPFFDWEDTIDPDGQGINSYGLQISEFSDFHFMVQAPSNLVYSSYTFIEALADDTTYYWRAKAIDSDGGITYTAARMFYINTSNLPPTSFDLLSPNSEIVLKKPSFLWQASSDPDPPGRIKYKIYYSSYSDFSTYLTVSGLTDTSYTLTSNLTESTTYYWKVEASDEYLVPASVFSNQTFSFYVKPVLPSSPANIKITNNIITWSPVLLDEDGTVSTDFSKYKIYRSTDIKNAGTAGTFAGYTTQTSTPAVTGYWTIIRAIDVFGNESANSIAVNPDESKQIFISNGRDLIIEIPQTVQSSLENTIISISKSGKIYDIKPLKSADLTEVTSFIFSAPVKITFETDDDCVYWYNGIEYVALGGQRGNSITVKTTKLGKFYTSSIQSSTLKLAYSFPTKIFTPNNDGINDEINLTFTGMSEEDVIAEVYDFTGRKISEMTRKDFSWFVWDGKDFNGKVVLPGIYIYQVRNGKNICNGTVVVAR